jgi:hypothetical protein
MKKLIVIKINNGGRIYITTKLFNISKTIVHQTTPEYHPTNMLKIDQHYYVDMPWIPTMIKE